MDLHTDSGSPKDDHADSVSPMILKNGFGESEG
jgi:hypothetical protein